MADLASLLLNKGHANKTSSAGIIDPKTILSRRPSPMKPVTLNRIDPKQLLKTKLQQLTPSIKQPRLRTQTQPAIGTQKQTAKTSTTQPQKRTQVRQPTQVQKQHHPQTHTPRQLDGDWQALWDLNYKREYYFNTRTGESVWEKPSGVRIPSRDTINDDVDDELTPSTLTLAQRQGFEKAIRNYLTTRLCSNQSMGSWKQLRKHIETQTNIQLKKEVWRDYIRSTASAIGQEIEKYVARNKLLRATRTNPPSPREEPSSAVPLARPKRYVCFVCDDDHSFHRCPILTDPMIQIMQQNLGYSHRKEWWYDKSNKQRARTFLRALESTSRLITPEATSAPASTATPVAIDNPALAPDNQDGIATEKGDAISAVEASKHDSQSSAVSPENAIKAEKAVKTETAIKAENAIKAPKSAIKVSADKRFASKVSPHNQCTRQPRDRHYLYPFTIDTLPI